MAKRIVRTIQRGEVIDQTPVDGNLVRVGVPKFISLVDLPANQTGFKVVRSDQGESNMSTKPTVRRVRRSETNPVLRLTFPEGTSEGDVQETLRTYGMTGYNVTNVENIFQATRSDLKSISNDAVQQIKLTQGGIMATVARSVQSQPANPKSQIALVGLEFDADKFLPADAEAWVQRNSVDNCETPAQNSDETLLVVKRGDVADGEEVRRLQLEEGVTAVIKRDDDGDVPDMLVIAVSEIAYGQWGWGQIDFNAAMADDAFCDAMDDAIYTLRDVLWNVVFYNDQPLDMKKGLISNCLTQFGGYVNGVMDSLPRQVLVSVARSAQPTEKIMSTKETQGSAAGAAGSGKSNEEFVKRSDLKTIIREALDEQKADTDAEAMRAAAAKTEAEKAAEAGAQAAEVQRAAIATAVAEAVAPLNEQIAKLAGATTLRGAPETAGVTNVVREGKEVKTDVFRGAIPGIGGSRGAATRTTEAQE